MARCPLCNCDPDEIEQAKILLDGIIAPPILPSLEDPACPNCGLRDECQCLRQ
jgi:hypothetical protein